MRARPYVVTTLLALYVALQVAALLAVLHLWADGG